jgi:DNA-binding response OmpR family regulator
MGHRPHIVVVEDEATQRRLLVDYLTRQNFRVSGIDGGTALRKLVEREMPALVLLDIGLPGEDGFGLARWLREKSARIGIVMVTAASETVDRVVGLETGADDYIAKPFEARELLARVKSVLRRATGAMATAGPRVPMGRRVLDLEGRVLVDPADGSEETLTASEFDLLKVFAENPNRPLQRDWLLEVTAHREMEPFDRAIDLRITRLRRKIEPDPAHPTPSAQFAASATCSCRRQHNKRPTVAPSEVSDTVNCRTKTLSILTRGPRQIRISSPNGRNRALFLRPLCHCQAQQGFEAEILLLRYQLNVMQQRTSATMTRG